MPPVVPEGYGFGIETRAAYGLSGTDPTIYVVDDLGDSGAGTLRDALEASGPRVIIFETSGIITLDTAIYVTNPYVTVAGQTAPSPGILVRGGGTDSCIEFWTHDVLLQHFAIRPGAWGNGDPRVCNSALGAWTTGGTPYNIVFANMSISWGQDENIYFAGGNVPINATVWRCIISEGLLQAPFSGACSGGGLSNGHGVLAYIDTQNVSILQSLFAHNLERNPQVSGGSYTYTANNLIYNAHEGPLYADPHDVNIDLLGTLIGNYIKRGGTASSDVAVGARYLETGSQLFSYDNLIDDGGLTPALTPFIVYGGDGIDPRVGTQPVTIPDYIPMSASQVHDFVLHNAGARPADRDDVDLRIVSEVLTRSGDNISSQDDVGGWPTMATNTTSHTVPSSPHEVMPSGYTRLEEWLHAFSRAVGTSGELAIFTPRPAGSSPLQGGTSGVGGASTLPCESHTTPTGATTNPGPVLPTVNPTWTPSCVGGGAVDSASNPTDAEDWAA